MYTMFAKVVHAGTKSQGYIERTGAFSAPPGFDILPGLALLVAYMKQWLRVNSLIIGDSPLP